MGYILFCSQNKISIEATKMWNGIIEYSYNNKKWTIWNGEEIVNNVIYMRGINNTIVSDGWEWNIVGEHIQCKGNIETLLDYKAVIKNIHPKIDRFCFDSMFYYCNLIEAPQLLSSNL